VTLGRELYLDELKQDLGEDVLLKKLASLSTEDKDELYSLSAADSRLQLRMRVGKDLWAEYQEAKLALAPVQEFFQVGGPRPWDGGRGRGGDSSSGRGGEGRDDRQPDRDGRGDGPMGRGDGAPGRGEGPPPDRRD
jgi:hypothetical protein